MTKLKDTCIDAFRDLEKTRDVTLRALDDHAAHQSVAVEFRGLKLVISLERGTVHAELLVPDEPRKVVSLPLLMKELRYVPPTNEPVLIIKGFLMRHEADIRHAISPAGRHGNPPWLIEKGISQDAIEAIRKRVANRIAP